MDLRPISIARSYCLYPDNHDRMVRLRQAKVDGIAADLAPIEIRP